MISNHPIGIANLFNKRYAVPGWYPIGPEVKVSDLKTMDFGTGIPEPQKIVKPKESKVRITEMVQSARSGETYEVKFNGYSWSCTCKGYMFRRFCKHIEEIKNKHSI